MKAMPSAMHVGVRSVGACIFGWRAVVAAVILAAACLSGGCSGRGEQRTPTASVSQTGLSTGYDPAWSPDGSQIAYVESSYQVRPDDGLSLGDQASVPVARTAICIWDPALGTRDVIQPAPASFEMRDTVITSLVWRNQGELAFLACEVGHDEARRRPGFRDSWHWLATYRDPGISKQLLVYSFRTRRTNLPHVLLPNPVTGLEPGKDATGDVVIWESRRSSEEVSQRIVSCVTLSRADDIGQRTALPPADWTGPPEGTARTRLPVVARKGADGKYCLSRLYGGSYQDFYDTDTLLVGAYGAPDGARVAFYQGLPGHAPIARMQLKVMSMDGGAAVTVTDDAYPWSRLAWSPDGTRIAYTRATDGQIVVADVPSS